MKKFTLIVTAIVVTLAGSVYAQKADTPKLVPAAPTAAAAPAAPAAKADPIDINSADEKTLMTLKGIGDVTAKKIVKSRPYSGKDDLVKKNVVTDKVYADIKDQIIAKQKK